jgi:hypothetical protein
MPVLYRITNEEMLASAGLDAYAVSLLLWSVIYGLTELV